MVPTPPVAKQVPRIDVVHGERRQDDYFWLRQKDHPEVTAHLEAENGYTDAVMKPTVKDPTKRSRLPIPVGGGKGGRDKHWSELLGYRMHGHQR